MAGGPVKSSIVQKSGDLSKAPEEGLEEAKTFSEFKAFIRAKERMTKMTRDNIKNITVMMEFDSQTRDLNAEKAELDKEYEGLSPNNKVRGFEIYNTAKANIDATIKELAERKQEVMQPAPAVPDPLSLKPGAEGPPASVENILNIFAPAGFSDEQKAAFLKLKKYASLSPDEAPAWNKELRKAVREIDGEGFWGEGVKTKGGTTQNQAFVKRLLIQKAELGPGLEGGQVDPLATPLIEWLAAGGKRVTLDIERAAKRYYSSKNDEEAFNNIFFKRTKKGELKQRRGKELADALREDLIQREDLEALMRKRERP